MPEEEPLDEREGMGDHVCDPSVEMAATGQGFLLNAEGKAGYANSLQQGLQCNGHTSSAGIPEI